MKFQLLERIRTELRAQLERLTKAAFEAHAAATDPGSNVVSFAYDAAGNRTALTNRLGNAFTFTYDANNRPISTSTPGGRSTTRAYDERGWLASLTAQPSGRQTTYQYDDQGRLTRQADSVGTNANTYDANGNLASRSDGELGAMPLADFKSRLTADIREKK